MVSTGGQHASPQVAWTGPVNGTSYDVITAANQAGGLDYWWVYDDSGLTETPRPVARLQACVEPVSRPRRSATAAASRRPETPSLARVLETWTLAGFRADEQQLSDLPVAAPGGDQCEHLGFARRAALFPRARSHARLPVPVGRRRLGQTRPCQAASGSPPSSTDRVQA